MNKNLIAALRCSETMEEQDGYGCANKQCAYRDVDGACDLTSMCIDAENALESAYAKIEQLKAENRDIRQHSVSHELYAQVCAERDEARKDCAEKNHMEIYQAAIDRYGAQAQMWMCVEECAELIQAINKYNRGIGDPANIAEEIADVEITIAQLEMILGNADAVEAEIKRKLDRLRRRLHDGREEA